jgi:hypothetical protein
MPSAALRAFINASDEISDLGGASHPSLQPSKADSLRVARAIGRGQVVLLSSHFERYFYAVNEELVEHLNHLQVSSTQLPEVIRLIHSMIPIDDLSKTGWEKRTDQLREFISGDGWLWSANVLGTLTADRLLAWMKAPKPQSLVRYYRYWGIEDIFSAITRTGASRTALWLAVQGLVDLRNNIAHGDFGAQTTPSDVRRYLNFAKTFCERADRKMSSVVARSLHVQQPW